MTNEQVYLNLVPNLEKVIKTNDLSRSLTLTSNLFHLGLDSIGVMELLVSIENQFQITFADDELSPQLFESVGNLVNKITSKCEQRTSN